MEKIKILQINKLYFPWVGGIEKNVQEISEGLSQDKFDIEVLVCKSKGLGIKEIINGIKIIKAASFGILYGMPISITFPFILAFKSFNKDILHFHLPFPLAVFSYLFFCNKRNKVIVTYHSDIVKQKWFMKIYEPFLISFLRNSNKILVSSPNLINSSKYLKMYKDKCTILPLFIDLNKYSSTILKADYYIDGISSNDKVVLFVGRLVYYKGIEFLIEAMQDVNAKLLIVGEGNLRNKLENIVKKLELSKKVIFLGEVPDQKLKYCYSFCDIFVLPSIENSEAFGIVQMEAMSFGKPVINTDLPTGVPFVSIHGKTGLTVPPKDSKALSRAMNKLLFNKKLYDIYSDNAIKRVKKKFSKSIILEKISKIYEGNII
jgi:rhamnosyl/mannosyltransferase